LTRQTRSLFTALVLATALLAPAVPALAQQLITATLAPLGGSNVRGTLTVEPPVGGIATLVVEPTGLAATTRYEASLHSGTCTTPSASAARLMGLLTVGADGRGQLMTAHAVGTGVGVAFELTHELLADGDHVVVVHEQGGSAVACGAIPRAVAAPTQLPRTGAAVPPLALAGLSLLLAGGAARVLRPRRTG
jgi:LPXTG-motif cell wall-anchored protein